MTTPLDPQLGPLRSEITFTLHTQYAHKLWMGRPMIRNEEGKVTQSSIISVPNCFAMLTQIQRAASEDDPYADDYLIQFEENVINYRKEIQKLTNDIVKLYAKMLPEGISIERCANISPISYPIYVNSQLGYQLLYLLGDFDSLCRSVMTAAHIAIINRADAQDWIEAGAKLIRKCFGIVERYKNSGITRRDYQENNARYQAAVKRMGYTTEIQADSLTMLGSRGDNAGSTGYIPNNPTGGGKPQTQKPATPAEPVMDNFDDDIPFAPVHHCHSKVTIYAI